jgi:hypothetical protein
MPESKLQTFHGRYIIFGLFSKSSEPPTPAGRDYGLGTEGEVAVYDERGGPVITFAIGRHTRPQGLASLRRTCLAALIALVAQFGLGMWLNLYVQVPAADQHAGIMREIENGPLLLTVHALVGTYLIGAAILLLVKAIRVRSRKVILPASAGLGAIIGAFIAGEFFVKNGESKASLWMALLTGISLLCYIYLQAIISAARMARMRPRQDDQAEIGQRPPGYRGGMPGRPPASRRPGSGPQPAYPQPGRLRPRPGNDFPRQAGPENNWPPRMPRRQNSAGFGYPEESLSPYFPSSARLVHVAASRSHLTSTTVEVLPSPW